MADQVPKTVGKPQNYTSIGRLSSAKAKEYDIVSNYKYGYRNREDITNLPEGVLIVGSQNVLTNVSERIQIREGYALDGATSVVNAAILSSFDWQTTNNSEVHLRAGLLTSAANDGKLQYRYVDTAGDVTWRDLLTSLTSTSFNFCKFWNTTELLREVLFVNGAAQIQKWNGATTTIASTTANTITKNGTATWAATGFYASTAGRSVVINGTTYTYTGGEGSTTLTGVAPSPAAEPANAVAHQSVITVTNATMTGGPAATYSNNLIEVLNNQVYLGSLTNSTIFISQVNSYTNYSFSATRLAGEGYFRSLDENPVAFIPQENAMYISAGKDLWYQVTFTSEALAASITELVNVLPLKTGRQQGAKTQAFTSHMKNNIIMVTNEPTVDMMGRIEQYFGTPMVKNISDPIKLDMDSYDFTDGSIFYFKYFIYVAVPKEGIVRMYNLATNSWEAPQTLPISRFYIVDGELYGHSYNTSESYKLFTGYADRVYTNFAGYPIDAKASFSYQNYGSRFIYKKANALYVEGYVNQNTDITVTLTYELDGCATTRTFTIEGDDTSIVCIPTPGGPLGKVSLGKAKLGGAGVSSLTGLPPKFRVFLTWPNTDFFESSVMFSVLGTDNRFELLAFGLNASPSTQEPVSIKH